MAVRWFFHQADERRIKVHSLGSAAPLQKEEGLNSFGRATILINNSIPHREGDGTKQRREGKPAPVLCGSISCISGKCQRNRFSFNLHFHHHQLFYFFSQAPFRPYRFASDFSKYSQMPCIYRSSYLLLFVRLCRNLSHIVLSAPQTAVLPGVS